MIILEKPSDGPLLSNRSLELACAVLGVSGGLMLAIKMPFSPVGWVFMMGSSLFGIPWAWRMKAHFMLIMQSIYMAINMIGVWRYLLPISLFS